MSNAPLGTRVFRGSSLEEVLPRVRAELGPDAIVVCEREGYVGGIAGFFTRRLVEVEACPPPVSVDPPPASAPPRTAPLPAQAVPAGDAVRAYAQGWPEEDTLVPGEVAVPAELLTSTPLCAVPGGEQRAFTAVLERAVREAQAAEPLPAASQPEREPEPELAPASGSAVAAVRPRVLARRAHGGDDGDAGSIRRELVLAGLDPCDADALVRQALVHRRPFAGVETLRSAVRTLLARSLHSRDGWEGQRHTIALAGSEGAAAADVAAALCSGYARAGLAVAALGLDGVRGAVRLASGTEDANVALGVAQEESEVTQAVARLGHVDLLVAVLPAVIPGDHMQQQRLGAMAAALAADDVQLVLPAGIDVARARAAHESLAAVSRVDAVLPTAVDLSPAIGGVVSVARTAGLALDWMALDGWVITVVPADADDLSRRILA